MADLRRLGKRGAYRLGQLGAPPSAPRRPPSPHYPSWVPGHRGPVTLWLLGCLATVAVIAAAAMIGWWFMPFVAGLAGGIASHLGRWRLRTALLATIVVAALGWAVPLGWHTAAVRATARVVAALAGLPAHSSVGIAATLLVAVLQALAGLWLGRALFPRLPRAA